MSNLKHPFREQKEEFDSAQELESSSLEGRFALIGSFCRRLSPKTILVGGAVIAFAVLVMIGANGFCSNQGGLIANNGQAYLVNRANEDEGEYVEFEEVDIPEWSYDHRSVGKAKKSAGFLANIFCSGAKQSSFCGGGE